MKLNFSKLILILLSLLYYFFLADKGVAGQEDVEILMLRLQHSNPNVRISAIEELGMIKSDEAVTALMDVIKDRYEDWKVQKRTIQVLSEIRDYRAVDLLIRILTDSIFTRDCPALKWNAAIALGNFKEDQKVFDTLIESLNDKILYIREAAIQSLGNIGNKKAVPYLIAALNDKNFAIKMSAIQAIGKIGDEEAVPFLEQIADSDMDEYLQAEALKALIVITGKERR